MNQTRKLAAIMFTDIVGYTALMGRDEDVAFAILEKNRAIHKQALQEFHGTWLKEIGDGVLCSFETITDAVYCAQRLMNECTKEGSFSLRIGIHQGEVVFDGDDVFGDGVNLASRIQSAAPAGGIYMSDSVARNIDNKKGVETRFVGEKNLKNVGYPVRIYEVIKDSEVKSGKTKHARKRLRGTGTMPGKMRLTFLALGILLLAVAGYYVMTKFWGSGKISGEKTIAILPFTNLNEDKETDFFVNGVHEDVINKLAGLKDLKVISRRSVLGISETKKSLIEIGKQLGANFIVEGSVSRINNRVKIMIQLYDAKTDKSLWSDNYERELNNVFALQNEIAAEITSTLNARISAGEKNRMNLVPTDNLAAYDNFIKARTILNSSQLTYEKIMQAIGLLELSTAADKKFAEAWGLLSQAQSSRYDRVKFYDNRADELNQAAAESEKALKEARKSDPEGVAALRAEGYYFNVVKEDPVNALRSFDKALEIFPNDSKTLFYQGMIFFDLGQISRVTENMEKAFAIDNSNPAVIYGLTFSYELAREYKKMVPFLERLLELEPEKTHYEVQARYFQFLAEGTLEAYKLFENAVKTVKKTEVYDERSIENNEMIVAMFNEEFEQYAKAWEGKWQSHYAGHGDWACPMIINEEVNHANLILKYGDLKQAREILQRAQKAITRPINEKAFCIFDKGVYEPKLYKLTGDAETARKKFDEALIKVMKNDRFPRGAVEKSVLLQTADLVAPDQVYALYKEITSEPVSFTGMEVICANPWTYPNLLKHPDFINEVKKDGRFVKFLEHYKIFPKA